MAVPDPIKRGLTIQLDNNKIRERETKAMIHAEKEIESQNFRFRTARSPQTAITNIFAMFNVRQLPLGMSNMKFGVRLGLPTSNDL